MNFIEARLAKKNKEKSDAEEEIKSAISKQRLTEEHGRVKLWSDHEPIETRLFPLFNDLAHAKKKSLRRWPSRYKISRESAPGHWRLTFSLGRWGTGYRSTHNQSQDTRFELRTVKMYWDFIYNLETTRLACACGGLDKNSSNWLRDLRNLESKEYEHLDLKAHVLYNSEHLKEVLKGKMQAIRDINPRELGTMSGKSGWLIEAHVQETKNIQDFLFIIYSTKPFGSTIKRGRFKKIPWDQQSHFSSP